MSNVYPLPGAVLEEPRPAASLNLSEQEIRDACGGYVRPADQVRELHARGFTRAYRARHGRGQVVLERSHYDAVTRGQYGPPAANEPAPRAAARPDRAGLKAFLDQKRKR